MKIACVFGGLVDNSCYLCKQKQSNMKLNRIKVVLVEKGIAQTQLAETLGKSFSTVNAYCSNRQQPSLEQLHKIAKVLSVTPKDLLNDIP